MLSMAHVMTEHTDLSESDRQWLRGLVNEWHLFADVSFSDLILWVPDVDDNIFWAAAQIRPTTGPTALEDDVVGDDISYDAEHLVTAAYMCQEISETSDNQLSAGIPVDVWAIPVMRGGRCIAVVERHTNQMGVRAPGALEDCYLDTADILAQMLQHGAFPISPPSEHTFSPRVGDGLLSLDDCGVIRFASPNAVSAYRKLGHAGDLEGEEFRQLTQSLVEGLEDVGQSFGQDLSGRAARELEVSNSRASVRLRIIPLLSYDDRPPGILVLCRDTTQLRLQQRQLVTKDATIREIHHRVKNNLQTVAALLRLQSRRIQSEEAKGALKDAMSRVSAIAVVHEILSQAFDEAVVFDDVADRILRMVGDVSASSGKVHARREGSFGMIPADVATNLSLVVTELCQNAVEHGLESSSGDVTVRPVRTGDELVVDVLDAGLGILEDFDMRASHSLGLSIVRTLVEDLGGTFTLGNRDDGPGARARVVLPLAEHRGGN
ncbi:MAG: sensor histidine kinase [Luteococcus sp.]|uniref:sensor histidine kinase n=1 Tax=Luteococcus sp. TaxID=1969402 RepID=UPI0026482436|nr:sensor histidine kinase [Luteococcus sp.]MDN5563662.1 sensor histidine kinase [Luteococcus sp.]